MKNELRIGNWVFGVSDRMEQITELLSIYAETSFRGGLLHYSNYEDITGIPLTPELLEMFGFTRKDLADLGEFISLRISEDMGLNLNNGTIWIGEYDTGIIHLHQLQNLYFALTGQELTITL